MIHIFYVQQYARAYFSTIKYTILILIDVKAMFVNVNYNINLCFLFTSWTCFRWLASRRMSVTSAHIRKRIYIEKKKIFTQFNRHINRLFFVFFHSNLLVLESRVRVLYVACRHLDLNSFLFVSPNDARHFMITFSTFLLYHMNTYCLRVQRIKFLNKARTISHYFLHCSLYLD